MCNLDVSPCGWHVRCSLMASVLQILGAPQFAISSPPAIAPLPYRLTPALASVTALLGILPSLNAQNLTLLNKEVSKFNLLSPLGTS